AAQYGGQGMSVFENVLVQEQLGQSKDVLVRRATGNVYECLAVGTDEQIEQYLLPSVSGERSCSLAISEPEAGSDIASIATTAIQTDNGWILNGRKCYISDAEFSDYFIVAAKTAPELDEKGISLFLVDKQSAGFSLGENFNMMGFIGTSHNELIFDNIALSPSALLGDENKGFFLLCNTLGSARLAKVAGRCLGKCVRLLKLMTEHINQRHQFGQSLAKVGVINRCWQTVPLKLALLVLCYGKQPKR
ncbi:MAG: acyl-CoA dehydrogenase family protein, partial [Gammaproteobacteria bacterium]|nr:acyl-CoA dehydrogenase family protein [Gammaproteobacteria bacterium]